MSGPERIWAWEGDGQDGWANAYATIAHVALDHVEYLRRDIADTLRGYCQHDDDCTINRYSDAGACSCGLSAALAKMGEG